MKNNLKIAAASLVALGAATLSTTAMASGILSIGVNAENQFRLFGIDIAGTNANVTAGANITGLAAGESIVGIDRRPFDGQVYAVVRNTSNALRLVTIDRTTGATSPVANLLRATGDNGSRTAPGGAPLALLDPATPITTGQTRIDIDFNPNPDLLRIVDGDDNNFRANPGTRAGGGTAGATRTDATLIVDGTTVTGPIDIVATAYSNSNGPTGGATTQFVIDAAGNRLLALSSPNTGIIDRSFGGLGINVASNEFFDFALNLDISDAAFDIGAFASQGLLLFTEGFGTLSTTTARFGLLNLSNGLVDELTLAGNLGGFRLIDVTAVSEPASLALFAAGLVGAGFAMRRRKTA
jgi:hypothetical protein